MWIGEAAPSELAESLRVSRSATLARVMETALTREPVPSEEYVVPAQLHLYCAPDRSVTCPEPHAMRLLRMYFGEKP